MTRSRDWIDYLGDVDRDLARSDSSYRAAIERTAVGQRARLQAEAAPLARPVRRIAPELVETGRGGEVARVASSPLITI